MPCCVLLLRRFPDMFDPAGFATNAKVRDIRRWRESEIVHGRVAMLAALGFIVGEQLEDIPAFLNADGHITGKGSFCFESALPPHQLLDGALCLMLHTGMQGTTAQLWFVSMHYLLPARATGHTACLNCTHHPPRVQPLLLAQATCTRKELWARHCATASLLPDEH